MFVIRLLALLALVAVIAGVVAYLFTGQRKYLGFSWRVFRWTVLLGLLVFALMIVERLAVIPL